MPIVTSPELHQKTQDTKPPDMAAPVKAPKAKPTKAAGMGKKKPAVKKQPAAARTKTAKASSTASPLPTEGPAAAPPQTAKAQAAVLSSSAPRTRSQVQKEAEKKGLHLEALAALGLYAANIPGDGETYDYGT